MCGLKISIICTDFNKHCFTYTNDERLKFDVHSLFQEVKGPVSMTTYTPEQVSK